MLTNDPVAGEEVLARLIAPHTLDEFLNVYWQNECLVVNRNDPVYWDDLVTLKEIDSVLANTPLPIGQMDLAQSAIGVDKNTYSNGDYVQPANVLRLHREGKTIIMRAMHLWLNGLKRACQGAGAFFNCDAQANLYMTPANTHSSYPHWDAHDIFVIQIAGSKRWLLHDSALENPLYTYQFNPDRHLIGPQTGEFTLKAGDVAYVPRGVAHHPITTEYSVHIALGVLVKTWADVLSGMYKTFTESSRACRSALPLRYGQNGFDLDKCSSLFHSIADAFLDPDKMRATVSQLSQDALHSYEPDITGMFLQLARNASPSLESLVEVPSSLALVEVSETRCHAILNGVELEVDRSLVSAVEFIRRHRQFMVKDIPAKSDAHRLALAHHLMQQGCLIVCDSSHALR